MKADDYAALAELRMVEAKAGTDDLTKDPTKTTPEDVRCALLVKALNGLTMATLALVAKR